MRTFPPLKLMAAGMTCLALSACGNVPELLVMGETRSTADSTYALRPVAGEPGCGPDASIEVLPPASLALLLGGFSLVASAASDAMADAVKDKAKRFSPSFVAARNVAAFGQSARCFLIVREPKKDAKGIVQGDGSRMELLLRFVSYGDGGLVVEPGRLRVDNGFLASTLPDKRTVSYDISVGLAVIPPAGADRWLVPTYNQNIRISRIALNEPYAGEDLKARTDANTTSLMPDPAGRPVTIAVSVTEHGSGAERFNGFDEERFKANSALIRTALGNYLKERLTAE